MRAWATLLSTSVFVLACGRPTDPATPRTLGVLAAAVDLDPDPAVVEVELVAELATVELLPGVLTEAWAYRDAGSPEAEATVPGPLLEVEEGQRLVVHVRNDLPQGTTVHWHGLRLPVEMDGNPMVSGAIEPGASFTYDFVVRDPGLHWYHPHVRTDEQVQRGLQGSLRVRGPGEPTVDVERVLMLDDVELDDDGAVVIEPSHDDVLFGRRGNVLLVNGRLPGHAPARGGTVERWRLVDTSNGRYFSISLPGHRLRVIGWDGGPVAEPYDVDSLVIAPGQRYDVLVALHGEHGQALELQTLAVDRGGGHEDQGPLTLLTLELTEPREPATPLPELAAPPPSELAPLPVDDQTTVQQFSLRHETGNGIGAIYFINDQRWPFNAPVDVMLGDTEIWEVINEGEHDHPFHLHGMFFQVLDRDGQPEPTLGWRDTVRVGPRGITRLAVRYEAAGMWMFHCSIPEHAERGMMGDLHVME